MDAIADTKPDIAEAWARYRKARSEAVRNELVERYLFVVEIVARKIHARTPDSVEIDDLRSEGVFGLMQAIQSFDPDRGVRFETYAPRRIRGAMLDSIRKGDWVPRLVRVKAKRLQAAIARVLEREQREPTDAEVAAELGVSAEGLEDLARAAHAVQTASLNRPLFESERGGRRLSLLDEVENPRAEDPRSGTRRQELMRLLTRGLNRSERLLVLLYYCEEFTMKEIGKTLALSESRVSQMHSDILRRMRKLLIGRRGELFNRVVSN